MSSLVRNPVGMARARGVAAAGAVAAALAAAAGGGFCKEAANRIESVSPAALSHPVSLTERELIEWDWRLQDGIGTRRAPSSHREAIGRTLRRG